MDGYTQKPEKLFAGPIQYIVPPYQRGYVWTEQKQWEPLWSDIEALAEGDVTPPHFMGTLVLMQQQSQVGDLDARTVVDGQQRLMTLLLLMDAVRREMLARELTKPAGKVRLLVHNPDEVIEDDQDHRWKLWPTLEDREDFRAALRGENHKGALSAAHAYFRRQAGRWLDADKDNMERRANELAQHLKGSLEFAVVDLSEKDNQWAIFETLNARGTPLLQTDLAKNFLVARWKEINRRAPSDADVADLWPLSQAWWKEKMRQGRLTMPRAEGFLFYWLVSVTGREVKTANTFQVFQQTLKEVYENVPEKMAKAIQDAGEHFKWITNATDGSTTVRSRLQAAGAGAVTPLLLLLSRVEIESDGGAGQIIETLIMRRTLARYASNSLNNLTRTLVQAVRGKSGQEVKDTIIKTLGEQTAASRRWPTSEEIREGIRSRPVYSRGNIGMARGILIAFEQHLRDPLGESFHGSENLSVEHVMPEKWEKHWPVGGPEDDQERREARLHTLGNLTLTTKPLNTVMSNKPWSDKKRELSEHSTLKLNQDLLQQAGNEWSVRTIEERAERMAQWAESLWPIPSVKNSAE